ncbi:hypothetical protein D3C81_911960 [compost metagenome]
MWRASQQRIPEARYRVGSPGFREHAGAFDWRRSLENAAPFHVGIEIFVANRIRPGVFDSCFDRGQRDVIGRQRIDVGIISAHLAMQRLKSLGVIRPRLWFKRL